MPLWDKIHCSVFGKLASMISFFINETPCAKFEIENAELDRLRKAWYHLNTFIIINISMVSQIIIISLIRMKRRINVKLLEIFSITTGASKKKGIQSRFSEDQVVSLFFSLNFFNIFNFCSCCEGFFLWRVPQINICVGGRMSLPLNPFLFPLGLDR